MMNKRVTSSFSFTLIELLIVVAIIGILAAIAVPNFLQAQIRAKLSRVVADFHMLRTALETYHIDRHGYPNWTVDGGGRNGLHPLELRYIKLTTPVAYISTIPRDPFATFANQSDWDLYGYTYDYVTDEGVGDGRTYGHRWKLTSWGPDQINSWFNNYPGDFYHISNGLISHGDVGAFGPKSDRPTNVYRPPLPHF
ncbi:MAG TPA: prepilin-type N-terminal cleavage/methylation domain-containing protein [bacterium]|nr:prepilin-type N-terminal cleavage/methylation domain-containing protein [bacterium]HOL92852.1 prepilin-type N-terminal cleavage/methylation domain-containing protein [bacterium]